MKISLNWLKKFTDVNLSLEDLLSKIGAQLGAIEEVVDSRQKYNGVKVVHIVEAKPHPNADKLNIYQVTDGKEQIQVVAGDKSLNVGDKVAWISPGSVVPCTFDTDNPFTIGSKEMRGVMSHGMLGSGRELALNDDDACVLKLDTEAKAGTPLATAYELDDVIIDIENKMFTHRPDCFGLIGVAREVAGIQGLQFNSPDWYKLADGLMLKPQATAITLSVANHIPDLCPNYQAAVLRDVVIKPSTIGMQSYLKRVGIRPINNVVDITNYLMYLTGQPLHAFDYDKVAKLDNSKHASIVVRNPKKEEKLTLLDGKEIVPHPEAVLICSQHKPIALGGVMGGLNSDIDQNTKNIVVESANFNMYSIRKTAMIHGIFTDAVTRFSKGQSPQQCGVVLAQTIELLAEHADATLASELGVEPPITGPQINLDSDFVNLRLGSDMQAKQVEQILEKVEIKTEVRGNKLHIKPPYWRMDLEIPEDIVEEVGRLKGFEDLPHQLPTRPAEAVSFESIEVLKSTVRTIMYTSGNNELQTYSFVAEKLLERACQSADAAYKIRNAISPELQLVRTSLLPSLLDKVHPNHKSGFGDFGLFEIGKSHNKYEVGKDGLPNEKLGLSYVFSADKKTAAQYSGAPFYQAKNQLGYLLSQLHFKAVKYHPMTHVESMPWWLKNLAKMFEPKRSAVVLVNNRAVGVVGEFTSSLSKNFKLPDFVAGFELDLGALNGLDYHEISYQPLTRFPSTDQDVCFKVNAAVSYFDLEHLIKNYFASDERLRLKIEPVDIYQRQDDEHKQMTYRIILQHHDKTLTTEEVNAHINSLAQEAQKRFGAVRV